MYLLLTRLASGYVGAASATATTVWLSLLTLTLQIRLRLTMLTFSLGLTIRRRVLPILLVAVWLTLLTVPSGTLLLSSRLLLLYLSPGRWLYVYTLMLLLSPGVGWLPGNLVVSRGPVTMWCVVLLLFRIPSIELNMEVRGLGIRPLSTLS